MLFSKSIRNLSKWVQTSKKCSTLPPSIWQKRQVSLWMRVFFVLHVTRQFKSMRNLGSDCRISGLRIWVIYGLNSTLSFNNDNTRKRDDVFMNPRRFWRCWSSSRWINILWKVCSSQFRRLSHISRKPFVHNIYCTLWIQSWLAVFVSRNASLRMAFSVPFSKRSQYLTVKPHALCIIGQRPNSAFTAFLLAYLLTFSGFFFTKIYVHFSNSFSFLSS